MKFQEPPISFRGPKASGSKYLTSEDQALLRDRPGEWALVLECVGHSPEQALRKWVNRHSGWEVTTRRSDGGTDVYVRWVGGAS